MWEDGAAVLVFDGEYLGIIHSVRKEAATGDVLLKKAVLRNFAKFTGKHLCQSLFFNKVAGRKKF